MNKKTGIIVQYNGKTFIVYDEQPLLEEKGKVIMYNVNDKAYSFIMTDKNKPAIKILDVLDYNQLDKTLIGYID